MSNFSYFESLIDELRIRSARAIQGLLGVRNEPLRRWLDESLTAAPGSGKALLAEPVFEPTFGWTPSTESTGSLSGKLLHPSLVQCMANPPKELADDYTFAPVRPVYSHQLLAWRTLCDSAKVQSAVITSGTGSGKTECFLVPILDSLARQVAEGEDLEGVQALFIYPLNALINSQKNRLDAWTAGFKGKVRYSFYTGELPDEARDLKSFPGQVMDRQRLRRSPPPILVTNATMLEYALVRKDDAPLLEKSRGKLKWIVLDEAHTLIGSQAAEMALLLRRVMLAFEVQPNQVRFVCTSATFGSDKQTVDKLQAFLADLSGTSPEQVVVIQGTRKIPVLEKGAPHAQTLMQLTAIDTQQVQSLSRYLALAADPYARTLREAFIGDGVTKIKALKELPAPPSAIPGDANSALRWLDVMSRTKRGPGDEPFFLPLRLHLFHNVLAGVRACINPQCSQKTGALLGQAGWPYGMAYLDERLSCVCGAPVLEVFSCTECAELVLLGRETKGYELLPLASGDQDEFLLEVENASDEGAEDEQEGADLGNVRRVVTNRDTKVTSELVAFNSLTRQLCPAPKIPSDSMVVFRGIALQGNEDECPCCESNTPVGRLFRRMAVGAPFTLSTAVSALLEYCPEQKGVALERPFRGRKLISFTDSRQGTARIAVKLQQDSERNALRSLVYHNLIGAAFTPPLSDDRSNDLRELLEKEAHSALSKFENSYLSELRKQQEATNSPAEINWRDMVSQISESQGVNTYMLDYYRNVMPNIFGESLGVSRLAEMLLTREFARRPKRANSLESLGLVQVTYPGLQRVTQPPQNWPASVEEWRAYLKNLLDFFVRENTIINLPGEWRHAIGARFSAKTVLSPHSKEGATSRVRPWPSVSQKGRQSRPIKLLCAAFGWEASTRRDQIDDLLRSAWIALTTGSGLLTPSGGGSGYLLRLDQIAFRTMKRAYLCPVTRRMLDTPFMGLTPYLPQKSEAAQAPLTQYDIPRYPKAFGGDADFADHVAEAREWIAASPLAQRLRSDGLWSDLHDRIIECSPFFRTAEHSAQQPRKRLDDYENKFKEGRINVLNCSTTMEMGIDISGISAVVMNNVPPHPSNYLQRAGRAGRRGEGRAISMTVARNNTHDQQVFSNPRWPFDSGIPMPTVSLSSEALVQRHVNAYLLALWMRTEKQAEQMKMTAAAFFDGYESSLAKQFTGWCENTAHAKPAIETAVEHLTRRSGLEGTAAAELCSTAGQACGQLHAEWIEEIEVVRADIEVLKREAVDGKKNAAVRAMQVQLDRMLGNYLLGELATRRFVPGYGFPTDVVTFNTMLAKDLKATTSVGQEREDNRARHRGMPSRDRVTALREYAPGAEIVLDGLVYRSGGVTLNWKRPAGEKDAKEAQLFKHAWRCHECGASGVMHSREPTHCLECNEELRSANIHRYLVPAGFAVDFTGQEPHTDITQPAYVPVQQPWLSLSGEFLSFCDSRLGCYRVSDEDHPATLYHHSSGAGGKGYAMCLECGRAEPMLAAADGNARTGEQFLPSQFRSQTSHRRLRGGKDEYGDHVCPGSRETWKIQTDVMLGHDHRTDAVEILIMNPIDGVYINDRIAAQSIAVALRDAVARFMGVSVTELGFGTRPLRKGGVEVQAIQVFDLRSGGYAAQIVDHLNDAALWKSVIEKLQCGHCDRACQHCLIGFDTRHHAERLDRKLALNWLSEQWLNLLDLPQEHRAFGQGTVAETAPLLSAVDIFLQRHSANHIYVLLSGQTEDWDYGASQILLRKVRQWQAADKSITLVACAGTAKKLNAENRRGVANLIGAGMHYAEAAPNALLTPTGHSLLIWTGPTTEGVGVAWATKEPMQSCTLSGDWGQLPQGALLLRGPQVAIAGLSSVTADEMRPTSAGDVIVKISSELDGPLVGFGGRFWDSFAKASPLIEELRNGTNKILEVIYTDRYVRSPLTASLLYQVIRRLSLWPTVARESLSLKIRGRSFAPDHHAANRTQMNWFDRDWAASEKRDATLRLLLSPLASVVEVASQPSLQHGRSLQLVTESGMTVELNLEQGFGHWGVPATVSSRLKEFPLNADASIQAKEIAKAGLPVAGTRDQTVWTGITKI